MGMVQVRSRFIALAAIAVALLVVVSASGTRGLTQDDGTPMASPEADGLGVASIPNHIHAGTCDELGEVVVPLSNAEFRNLGGGTDGTPMADLASPMASPIAGGMTGAASAIPVAAATTNVDLTLDEILASDHAINLHDPVDPSDPALYLACGDIGGTPDADGNLFIGLAEQNDSGHFGVAWLLDNGTGTTVTVFLAARDMVGGGTIGTPEADMGTPES